MAEIRNLHGERIGPALVNYEAEQSLLGGLLSANAGWYRVSTILRAEHFADAVHGRIYTAIGRMIQDGIKADPITLKAEFDRDPALVDLAGKPGKNYLQRLINSVVTLLNLPDYAEAIRDLWLRRQIIERTTRLRAELDSFDVPPDQMIAAAIADLQRLSTQGRETTMTRRAVAEALVKSLQEPASYTPTGISAIDEVMSGGMYAGKFYGFSGRKKSGKSALLGSISYNLDRGVEIPVPHLVCSLEMSPHEIEMRNAARHSGINAMRFLRRQGGEMSDEMTEKAVQYACSVSDATIYEHCPGATIDELCNSISRAIVRNRIKGAIVDYWQLVGGKAKNETEEYHLRNVADRLAALARKMGIWVAIGSQLNQEGNTRGGEGLRLAVDMLLAIHHEPGSETAWMEMQDSRYTPYQNIGSEDVPGLWFHKNGTYFDDNPPPGTQVSMLGDI